MESHALPPTPTGPPAGWYGDSSGPRGQQRYWNGASWTDHTQFAPPSTPPVAAAITVAKPAARKTRWWAWIVLGLVAISLIASVAGGSGTSSSSSSSSSSSDAQTVAVNQPIT